MNQSNQGKRASRTGRNRPTAARKDVHRRTANSLYRLYATRCIACYKMSPAEAAYRNEQYELLGIRARWIGENENRRRIPASAPPLVGEAVRSNLHLQRPMRGDMGKLEAE